MPILVIGAVCIFAIWKGDREARIAAIAFALCAALAPILKDHRFIGPQWATFVLDIAYLVMITVIALRTKKYWPLFAAGFQLLQLVTHTAAVVDRQLGSWAYITASVIWSYLLLFSFGIGAWNHWMLQREAAAFNERER